MSVMIETQDFDWEGRSRLLADALASQTDNLTDDDVARLACHFGMEASSREGDHVRSVALYLGAKAAHPDSDMHFEVAAALALGMARPVLGNELNETVRGAVDPILS